MIKSDIESENGSAFLVVRLEMSYIALGDHGRSSWETHARPTRVPFDLGEELQGQGHSYRDRIDGCTLLQQGLLPRFLALAHLGSPWFGATFECCEPCGHQRNEVV